MVALVCASHQHLGAEDCSEQTCSQVKQEEEGCEESGCAETPLLDEGALRPCHCASSPPSGRPSRLTISRPGRSCHSCHRQRLGPLHRSQAKATFGQTQPGPNIYCGVTEPLHWRETRKPSLCHQWPSDPEYPHTQSRVLWAQRSGEEGGGGTVEQTPSSAPRSQLLTPLLACQLAHANQHKHMLLEDSDNEISSHIPLFGKKS